MSKPTPGPYKIHPGCNNTGISDANGVPIATFYGEYGSTSEQARANAEAWIAGVAAVEKLERIRDICWNQNEPVSRLAEIVELLRSNP